MQNYENYSKILYAESLVNDFRQKFPKLVENYSVTFCSLV